MEGGSPMTENDAIKITISYSDADGLEISYEDDLDIVQRVQLLAIAYRIEYENLQRFLKMDSDGKLPC